MNYTIGFCKIRREFPWRKDPTPYKVWVSEIMLQQTRASVVIPYFERWMELFPDVEALANAPLDKVIKAWEGLGYYSRARNLHQGAIEMMKQFGGQIPSHKKDLASICGIGPYTVGAILSFAFRQRAPAIDGNVTRVLSRYFAIEENVTRQSVKKQLEVLAESMLDVDEPWVSAEALIELGATICTPRPKCEVCPLKTDCQGWMKAESLPIKNGPQEIQEIQRAVIVLSYGDLLLVKKGEAGKVMAGLYEFPYFPLEDGVGAEEIAEKWGVRVELVEKLSPVTHTFTRFRARLYPTRYLALEWRVVEGYEWIAKETLFTLPFSAGHRKVLKL